MLHPWFTSKERELVWVGDEGVVEGSEGVSCDEWEGSVEGWRWWGDNPVGEAGWVTARRLAGA